MECATRKCSTKKVPVSTARYLKTGKPTPTPTRTYTQLSSAFKDVDFVVKFPKPDLYNTKKEVKPVCVRVCVRAHVPTRVRARREDKSREEERV